jgi:hypothetical protein
MKELCRKFSADENESPNPADRSFRQPERYDRPVCHDLRFVMKESLNLGFRFIDEFDRMLKKFKEDEPGKNEGESKGSDPA